MHRRRRPTRRSTPAGQHRPVMLNEVLEVLRPAPGEVAADCTAGWAGHSRALLERVGPTGRLIALDLDPENLAQAQARLAEVGGPFSTHHMNFAGLPGVLGEAGLDGADVVLADLGMSSMQVDDADRGFSYMRDGPLDMRMDRTRGRPASELLAGMEPAALAEALREYGDEPAAIRLAPLIVTAAREGRLARTTDLARLLLEASGAAPAPAEGGNWKQRKGAAKWETHPAARTFQALRILVNRELANLEQLLRMLPTILRPGGRVAIISFHSGEDRLVKAAFREGKRAGIYAEASDDPVRASFGERTDNPRSRSAKLRWAQRGASATQP